jgi:hypothetical protein
MQGIMRVFFFALLFAYFLRSGDCFNDYDRFDFFHVSFLIFEKVMRRKKAEAREVQYLQYVLRACKMMVEAVSVGDEQQLPLDKPMVEALFMPSF